MAAIWNLIAKYSFWTPLSSSVWICRTFLCSLFCFDLSCCHCEHKTSWVLLAWWDSAFVQSERLINYYYQVWPPCIKILNLKPNHFLSPTIPILRIGVSYLIQDHLRTYYWWILGLLLSISIPGLIYCKYKYSTSENGIQIKVVSHIFSADMKKINRSFHWFCKRQRKRDMIRES